MKIKLKGIAMLDNVKFIFTKTSVTEADFFFTKLIWYYVSQNKFLEKRDACWLFYFWLF